MEDNSNKNTLVPEVTGEKVEKPGTFKKGDDPRRNLEGRPVGSKSFTTKVRDALMKIAEGKDYTYEEAFIKSILKNAIVDGDNATQRLIWNYLDGMPQQNIGIGGRDGDVLKIEFADAFKKDVNTPPATN